MAGFIQYDTILIVGNGFDINLGFPTSYLDFIESKNFKSLLADRNKLAEYLKTRTNSKNWIDIELELKRYSKIHKGSQPDFHQNFIALSSSLKEYLLGIDYQKFNTDSYAYKLMSNTINEKTLIVDFNYTNSMNNVLNELKTPAENYIKIHGSLSEDNIIFGIEDKSDFHQKDNFLLKSYYENYNPVDLDDSFLYANEFIVFGHSLGETDHPYFKDMFFKCANTIGNHNKKDIKIYCYGEKSKNEISSEIHLMTKQNIRKLRQINNFQMIDIIK